MLTQLHTIRLVVVAMIQDFCKSISLCYSALPFTQLGGLNMIVISANWVMCQDSLQA